MCFWTEDGERGYLGHTLVGEKHFLILVWMQKGLCAGKSSHCKNFVLLGFFLCAFEFQLLILWLLLSFSKVSMRSLEWGGILMLTLLFGIAVVQIWAGSMGMLLF